MYNEINSKTMQKINVEIRSTSPQQLNEAIMPNGIPYPTPYPTDHPDLSENGEIPQPAKHIYQIILNGLYGFMIDWGKNRKNWEENIIWDFSIHSVVLRVKGLCTWQTVERKGSVKKEYIRKWKLLHSPLIQDLVLSFEIWIPNSLPDLMIKDVLDLLADDGMGISDYYPYFKKFEVIKFEEVKESVL